MEGGIDQAGEGRGGKGGDWGGTAIAVVCLANPIVLDLIPLRQRRGQSHRYKEIRPQAVVEMHAKSKLDRDQLAYSRKGICVVIIAWARSGKECEGQKKR